MSIRKPPPYLSPRGGAPDGRPAALRAATRCLHLVVLGPLQLRRPPTCFPWVYATSGDWSKALHYVPPLFAFVLGIIMASARKIYAGQCACHQCSDRNRPPVHCRHPAQPTSLDRRHPRPLFVAAFQTASFPKVEGWNYSSVMATSNFRYAIESLFAAFAGSSEARPFRRPYVFGAMCIAFGIGAAIGPS